MKIYQQHRSANFNDTSSSKKTRHLLVAIGLVLLILGASAQTAIAQKPNKKKAANKKTTAAKAPAANKMETAKATSSAPTKSIVPTSLMDGDFGKGPTYIKSNSLTLKPKDRIFTYQGEVEVKHQDMVLSCTSLEGVYDENNQIKSLTAVKDVLITKGAGIKAHGERAVYDGATSVLTLTDNPELEQNGSVLTADKIKIYMKENRSEAEGAVRMKMASSGALQGETKDLFKMTNP